MVCLRAGIAPYLGRPLCRERLFAYFARCVADWAKMRRGIP